jgi:DNA adenine methylase
MKLFGSLPIVDVKPVIPPIKCQGIKSRLVRFILENIRWEGKGRWVEPFLGSGVVLFSVQPERALISDINPHIIKFYRSIADESLTPAMAREHLTQEGGKLECIGEDYYYEVRQRFNTTADPLDFLFLSRACFNGVMRFNRSGKFNVPFCRKPERFRQAYITKIVNQIISVRKVMLKKDWEFRIGDWRACIRDLHPGDFVYLDPPYIGRHTDYFNQWSESDALELASAAQTLSCGYALSMWKENKYRTNDHLGLWNGTEERTLKHFYHVGSTEDLRNEMEEALLIRKGHSAPLVESAKKVAARQAGLFF